MPKIEPLLTFVVTLLLRNTKNNKIIKIINSEFRGTIIQLDISGQTTENYMNDNIQMPINTRRQMSRDILS